MVGKQGVAAKSVQFSQFGGVEVLDLVEVERPTAGPGEVVVRVSAAGINHIEADIRDGKFASDMPTGFPMGQGSDFAGIVSEVGAGVTDLSPGSEVMGHAAASSHANYVVVPQRNVIPKPAALSWETAGSLFLAGVAAYDALQSVTIGPGDTVVISAAAGGVGSIETQLAMLRGATVIGTCSERNFDYLRQLGAHPVLYGDGMVDRIRQLAPAGVSAYLDNFGQNNADSAAVLGVDRSHFRSAEDRTAVELRALTASEEDDANNTRILARLATMAAEKRLTLLISGFYPLEQVREAFVDLEKQHARGKFVLGMRSVVDSFHDAHGPIAGDYDDRGHAAGATSTAL